MRSHRTAMPAIPAMALVAMIFAAENRAGAQLEEQPSTPNVDPAMVPGSRVLYTARPRPPRDARFCSTKLPLCIHATVPAHDRNALTILDAFERAWATSTGALELPAPDVAPDTNAYDVFLADAPDPLLGGELAATLLEARDVRSNMDRARSFTVLDGRLRAGCQLDALAARSLAQAMIHRSAPATDEATERGQATFVSWLVAPCSVAFAGDAVAAFQSRVDRALPDARADQLTAAADDPAPSALSPSSSASRAAALYADGQAVVWSRLDWAFARAPGALVLATWALAPTMTPPGARRWVHEPDTYDVLRASFKDRLFTGSTIHDLFLDLAVSRAFMGSADDGLHAPETRALDDATRVPLDWDLPWPATPRRLAPRMPVHPTGASYVLVRTAGRAPGARLRVEITWEEHALFRWVFVKLDGAGRELGRLPIPAKERATEAQMTLVDLEGVDRILLVGANVGDPAYAFDPDEAAWEPHSWLVTIAPE
jgi:hypothetical protein